MKDKLAEFYKLAGFKSEVAKELMHAAHKCIEAAYLWENDRVRKECIKAKLKPAASDRACDAIDILLSYEISRIHRCLDRNAERASRLAEETAGDPNWKDYKEVVDKFS